jgi:hypothetical protein
MYLRARLQKVQLTRNVGVGLFSIAALLVLPQGVVTTAQPIVQIIVVLRELAKVPKIDSSYLPSK